MEKYIQDKILEFVESDMVYDELNKEILQAEKEFKEQLTNSQKIKYNELEELVIKSVIHLLVSACNSLIRNPHHTTFTPS